MAGSSRAGSREKTPLNSPHYEIISVKGRSREEKLFIDFPKELYRGNPCYVPFFDMDMRMLIRKKHPFFLHSEGEFILLLRDGRPAARCLVTENRRYNDFHGTRFAFFDFFDCIDDQKAAHALFDYCAAWTRERGLSALTGPMPSAPAGLAYSSRALITPRP